MQLNGVEMALVSKTEAAKLTGKSRTTIHSYVNKGKLSATDGKIETSELIRVFGELKTESYAQPAQTKMLQSGRNLTPDQTARIRDLENQNDELRQDRDSWRVAYQDQAQANQRLLENKAGQDQGGKINQYVILGMLGLMAMIVWLTQK